MIFIQNSNKHDLGISEDGNIVIKFNNKWYPDLNSFFEKAKIGGRPVTVLYDELIDYQIES